MPASMKLLEQVAGGKSGSAKSVARACFALWEQDQLIYSVKVLECDKSTKRCKVEFEDGFTGWMEAGLLHLELDIEKVPEELIVCALCDGELSESPNDIVICDGCYQGFHVRCHQPNIPSQSIQDDSIEWHCAICQKMAAQVKAIKREARLKRDSQAVTPKKTPSKQKINNRHKTSVKGPAKVKITARSTLPTPTPTPSISPPEPNTSSETTIDESPETKLKPAIAEPVKAENVTFVVKEKKEVKNDKAKSATITGDQAKTTEAAKMETMSEEVIKAAQTLACEDVAISTKEFVNQIATASKGKKVIKVTKVARKQTQKPNQPANSSNKTSKPVAPAY